MGYSKFFIEFYESFFVVLVMGKAEGKEHNWHGHITAVSIAPQFRRMKLAATFMKNIEMLSDL